MSSNVTAADTLQGYFKKGNFQETFVILGEYNVRFTRTDHVHITAIHLSRLGEETAMHLAHASMLPCSPNGYVVILFCTSSLQDSHSYIASTKFIDLTKNEWLALELVISMLGV